MLPQEYLSKVRTLLEKSLAIWSRKLDLSGEEKKVVTALRLVLKRAEGADGYNTIDLMATPQAVGGENQ
jgi:hypothetical protein